MSTTAISKSQTAYNLLSERITEGTYMPGQRIVLGQIAEEIGASSVPVREAVRRLQAEGMLTFEKNVGARVTEIDESEYLDTMQAFSVIEGAAVALAAPHLTITALSKARHINGQMREMLSDLAPERFTSLNEEFHRLLSDACPNSHLCELVDRSWQRLARLRRSTFTYVPERARESVAEHEKILQLIGDASDPLTIELAVREHRLATPKAFSHRLHSTRPTDPIPN